MSQWIAFAAMGPALVWMLRAWIPRRAAWVATARFVVIVADSSWTSGYMGSAAAVTGSALIFGALRRLSDVVRASDSIFLGLGVVLLAFTRPFEGRALSLALALFFAVWIFWSAATRRDRLLRVALPTTLVIAAGTCFQALHSHAVTGNPLHTAYSAYEAGAPGTPPFIWQESAAPPRPLRITEHIRLRIDMTSYRKLRDW